MALALTLSLPRSEAHATGPVGLVSPPASTENVSAPVSFSSGSQDIWSPVAGGGDVSWDLINAAWDVDDDVTKTVGVTGRLNLDCDWNAHWFPRNDHTEFHSSCNFDTSTVNLGGKLDASVFGHINLAGEADGLQGSASVSYPGDVALSYPSVDSFLAGETVSIDSGWTLGAGATIVAGETRGDLQLNSDLRIGTDIDVTVYTPGASTASIADFDWQDASTLFSFAAAGGVSPPPAATGITGSFSPISVQPSGVSVSGGTVTISGSNTFSSIDIDKLVSYLPGAPKLGASISAAGASVSYDVFDADANVDFSADQTLTFDADVWVRLDFDRPVGSITGPCQSVDPGREWVIFEAGEQIDVQVAAGEIDPIVVSPSVYLSNQFTNQTTVNTDSSITLKAGQVEPHLPGLQGVSEDRWVQGMRWVHT